MTALVEGIKLKGHANRGENQLRVGPSLNTSENGACQKSEWP